MTAMRPKPIKPERGRESVWDYPRPPRLERTTKRLEIVMNGVKIADTNRAYRVLETSHPPVYYIPLEDVRREYLEASSNSSFCEWKGGARYYTVRVGDRVARDAAWFYPSPTPGFAPITNFVAFYAGRVQVLGGDGCFVDGERVTPQPGGFYGGWITRDIAGPFKGEAGSAGW
jgi:uncharacterized protein (DUF427 family)